MAWAGIRHNGRTPLHIFEHHIATVLQDHVCIFRNAVSPDFLIMDDNASRSVEVSVTLQSENILPMQWAAYYLDLNTVEHAWDDVGRRVEQRTIPPRTVQELITTLREEWDNIPQRLLDSSVKSMENRCKMCISVRGQHTSY
ncbi:transposable element Tcb2 transposase [Trichonephila clavipes]|nr:transposable element Tcb2 transposase [Trichonephila clavipes]